MPELATLPKLPDSIAHLRDAIDAHKQATQASIAAGAAVQAEKVTPPATTESST